MKNKTMSLIIITLLVVMIALVLVSSTYAKYTSNATGSDTARVAKWSFKVGETDITTSNTFTFDLFNTIKEADTSSAEGDVTSSNSDIVIAPGTGGSFDIVLVNDSEVSAKYAIDYTVTNTAKIPVEYSVDGGSTWTTSLANVVASDDVKLNANGGTTTITVQWRWAYEGGKYAGTSADETATDEYDTALGKGGTAELTVQAKLTATQVN